MAFKNDRLVSNDEMEKIKKLYLIERLSASQISKLYNCSHTTIYRWLKNMDIIIDPHRNKGHKTYIDNNSYFEKINTPDKAYFLGFLYADGNMSKERHRFSLKLTSEDKIVLEKLREHISPARPFYIEPAKIGHRESTELCISGKKICEDLVKLGFVPVKSLVLQFPTEYQVPNYLLRYFLRGYFEGDGCISFYKTPTRCKIGICVSEMFGDSFKQVLSNLNINSTVEKRKNNKIHNLVFGGRKQCLKFFNYIYSDNLDYILPRKYEKFLILKNYKRKN